MYVYGDKEDFATIETDTAYVQATRRPPRRRRDLAPLVVAVSVFALLASVVACTGNKIQDSFDAWLDSLEQVEEAIVSDNGTTTDTDIATKDGWRVSVVGATPLSISYYGTVEGVVWLRLELGSTYELGYLYYQASSVGLYYDGAELTSSVIITFDEEDNSVLVGFQGAGAFTFDVLTAKVSEAGSVAWHTWDSITLLVEEA